MKLLIHGCCADCTLKFVESIKKEKLDFEEIAVYFYNPNIHPRSEYHSRLKALQLTMQDKSVRIIIPDWKPSEYFKNLKSNKKPERCISCWNTRLEKTSKFAKENSFSHFSSTLLSSQYQSSEMVTEIGEKLALKNGVIFFKPKKMCKDLQTKGFYKQIFCGCVYSLTERMEEKFKENGKDN